MDIGNASTTRRQWLRVQHRDTLASLVSHPNTKAYLSMALDKSQAELRHEMILKMVDPLRPFPVKELAVETTLDDDGAEMEIE